MPIVAEKIRIKQARRDIRNLSLSLSLSLSIQNNAHVCVYIHTDWYRSIDLNTRVRHTPTAAEKIPIKQASRYIGLTLSLYISKIIYMYTHKYRLVLIDEK